MALYIPAGRRRRRLIIAVVVTAILGLTIGWAIGHATAPTVDDRVSSVRSQAQAIDAQLASLPIEYEKVLSGDPQYANGGGPADTLTTTAATTRHLTEQAPWLSAAQADAVVAAVDQAQSVAASKQPADQFQTAVDQATAAINQTFGLDTN